MRKTVLDMSFNIFVISLVKIVCGSTAKRGVSGLIHAESLNSQLSTRLPVLLNDLYFLISHKHFNPLAIKIIVICTQLSSIEPTIPFPHLCVSGHVLILICIYCESYVTAYQLMSHGPGSRY